MLKLTFRESDSEGGNSEAKVNSEPKPAKRKRSKVNAGAKLKPSAPSGSKKVGKSGPSTILGDLIEEGFFDGPQTIGKIMEHSDSKKGGSSRQMNFRAR